MLYDVTCRASYVRIGIGLRCHLGPCASDPDVRTEQPRAVSSLVMLETHRATRTKPSGDFASVTPLACGRSPSAACGRKAWLASQPLASPLRLHAVMPSGNSVAGRSVSGSVAAATTWRRPDSAVGAAKVRRSVWTICSRWRLEQGHCGRARTCQTTILPVKAAGSARTYKWL